MDALTAQLSVVEREIDRLTSAIAAGGQMTPLLEALKARQERRDELAATITARGTVDVRRLDRAAIKAQARARLTAWRDLVTSHVAHGRQWLREVLIGPLRFTPDGRTYRFQGELSYVGLLQGVADLPTSVVAVRGIVEGCTVKFSGIAA